MRIFPDINKLILTASGKKASDMKNVEIYVKPEESRAYFVVNGTENGSFLI